MISKINKQGDFIAYFYSIKYLCIQFSVLGATLCKGLNRGFGTLCAGSLAFFIEFMAEETGRVYRAVFIGTTVFLVGMPSYLSSVL